MHDIEPSKNEAYFSYFLNLWRTLKVAVPIYIHRLFKSCFVKYQKELPILLHKQKIARLSLVGWQRAINRVISSHCPINYFSVSLLFVMQQMLNTLWCECCCCTVTQGMLAADCWLLCYTLNGGYVMWLDHFVSGDRHHSSRNRLSSTLKNRGIFISCSHQTLVKFICSKWNVSGGSLCQDFGG